MLSQQRLLWFMVVTQGFMILFSHSFLYNSIYTLQVCQKLDFLTCCSVNQSINQSISQSIDLSIYLAIKFVYKAHSKTTTVDQSAVQTKKHK